MAIGYTDAHQGDYSVPGYVLHTAPLDRRERLLQGKYSMTYYDPNRQQRHAEHMGKLEHLAQCIKDSNLENLHTLRAISKRLDKIQDILVDVRDGERVSNDERG